jgi:2,4-dienoyl-CoA reductase-like NADH-dependent reductase (Old Yellow Enzyme family)
MALHEAFAFRTLEELEEKVNCLHLDLSFSRDFSSLFLPVKVGHLTAPNALACLPMEGCDSNLDGSPGELTKRRYRRIADGGYGLIWWEACAVVSEGCANSRQLRITKENMHSFQNLLEELKAIAEQRFEQAPLNILQLTHSGRYSHQEGVLSKKMIVQRDPFLDQGNSMGRQEVIVSDDYLESLVPLYVRAAQLAQDAGFDGVDIKACHRYLLSELLAARERKGRYGGDFLNRVKLLLDIVRKVRITCGEDFVVACRFNAFDAHQYPYGFGSSEDNPMIFDEEEPAKLVELLISEGVGLLACSAGNPYYKNPYVTRPMDRPVIGASLPDEHPLESVSRLFAITKAMQKRADNIPIVGSGYSWLRHFWPYAGAANLASKGCGFVGLGRSVFAYPCAPQDLLNKGKLNPERCCIACSMCTQLMRDGGMAGCVVRDPKVYAPLYKEYCARKR